MLLSFPDGGRTILGVLPDSVRVNRTCRRVGWHRVQLKNQEVPEYRLNCFLPYGSVGSVRMQADGHTENRGLNRECHMTIIQIDVYFVDC